MTTAAIALTLGIISAVCVIIVMCMIIVGAASDPLSQFDGSDERSRDGDAEGAIPDRVKGQLATHFGDGTK